MIDVVQCWTRKGTFVTQDGSCSRLLQERLLLYISHGTHMSLKSSSGPVVPLVYHETL